MAARPAHAGPHSRRCHNQQGSSADSLAKAPDPASAARLTTGQISAALTRARRRGIPARASAIRSALQAGHLHQPQPVAGAYAATVRSLTVVIAALNGEIAAMERQVTACFRGHPDAAIYLSQPGIADVLGARELGEFGDDPHRYASAKARKNYAATSPVTRQSGKKKIVLAGSSATTGSPTPCTSRRKAP